MIFVFLRFSSFSTIISRSIHVATDEYISQNVSEKYSIVYLYHILLHPFIC